MSKTKNPSNKETQEVVSLLTTTGSLDKNTAGNLTNKDESQKANATRPQAVAPTDDTVNTDDNPEQTSITDKNKDKGDLIKTLRSKKT